MARICYQFPIKDAHGNFEKGGMVFKVLGDARFTQSYSKPSTPPTANQLTARENFRLIATRVAGYKHNEATMATLRNDFNSQSAIKSFNKFLWAAAKAELGI